MPKRQKNREPQITEEQIEAAREKLKDELESRKDNSPENAAWWLGEF